MWMGKLGSFFFFLNLTYVEVNAIAACNMEFIRTCSALSDLNENV